MGGRRLAAMATVATVAAALALVARDGFGGGEPAGRAVRSAPATPPPRPHGAVEDCSTRSEAAFPAAFSDPRNVVAGPLVLVGAAYTPPETVREFGGDKFPVLVRSGHRVTVAVPRRLHGMASLGYGPLPEGVEAGARAGHRVVTFVACRDRDTSGSTAGGEPVTFWSGFVLTASPRCVPLEVWVDDEPSPRRAALRMGVPHCR